MATNFNDATAQIFYGIVTLGVSFSNMAISHSLKKIDSSLHFGWLYSMPDSVVILDIAIKVIGLIISATIYAPAMLYAIFIDMFVLFFASSKLSSRSQA